MNAIIYTRVSTTEQAELNYSLQSQEETCIRFAERNNYYVLKIFKEKGESAKTTNRTELKKLLTFIQLKHQKIDYLIVFKLDRLARNLLDYTSLVNLLSQYDIMLKSATETIGETPEGKLMQNIIASFAQYDNDAKSQRTKIGMKQAVEEGRWIWVAPFGYEYERRNDKSYLVFSKHKIIVEFIFTSFLKGKRQYEIVSDLRKKGFKFGNQKITDILSNPIYISKIRTKLCEGLVDGIHEPIIDEITFYKVQSKLGNEYKSPYNSIGSKDFSLTRFLKCPYCNSNLKGSWSKGWSKKYPYYHCTKKGCSYKPIRREQAEFLFIEFLNSIEPKEDVINRVFDDLKNHSIEKQKDIKRIAKQLKREITELEEKKDKIEDLAINGTFTKERFQRKISEVEKQITDKKIELQDYEKTIIDITPLLENSKNLLRNISKLWINTDIAHKRKLQEVIFPDGIFIENEKCRTDRIASIFGVFQQNNGLKSKVVPEARIELARG